MTCSAAARQPRSVVVLLLLAAVSGGCTADRPGGGDHELSGTVTYGGEPASEGRLALLGPTGLVATTPLGSDGTFRLVNPPTGRVRVAVVNHPVGRVPVPGPFELAPGLATCSVPARPVVRFPERYADPATSDLVAEIAPGQGRLDITLPRQPNDPPVVRPADRNPVGVEAGDLAPDISGDDLDGSPFRLSEYRGRVVVLLFWGHWCKLCRDRFERERELVDRMTGRPFVLLGVNCDTDKDLIRRENARRGINWRSWRDGRIPGPVATAWRIQGLPYAVLIDHTGVVRARAMDAEGLDQAVDDLVRAVPPGDSISHSPRAP